MRFLILNILIFVSISTAHASDEAKFKIRCRKIIRGNFNVDKFDDWKIVANTMDSRLSGVSIDKGNKALPDAVPNNFKEHGKMSGAWRVDGDEYWLACHHPEMKMVIQQKLPGGLKTCVAKEDSDAVAIECR